MNIELTMTPKQREVLESTADITLFSAGRGCGKTAMMAIISILNMMKNKRVLVINTTYSRLKDSSFYQTRKFLGKMGIPYQSNLTDLKFYSGQNGEIIHVSADNPEDIRSYTSIDVIIFDESASLSEDCWKLAIPIMRDTTDGNFKIYVVGTPPASENHWVAKLAKREDVKVIFGSYLDNPFNSEKYTRMLEKEYEHYPYDFRRRELFGEFIFTEGGASLFDDFRIEQSTECSGQNEFPIVCGLDIAGPGRDMTCAVISRGNHVLGIYIRKTTNEISLKHFLRELFTIYGFSILRYDSTGLGTMIVFDLPSSVLITPVNFATAGGERFNNMRTAMYSHLRRKNGIFMHPDIYAEHAEALLLELKATTIEEKENKKVAVTKKEEIKKKIGRSPDRADALALAMSHIEVKRTKPHIAPRVFGGR
ncbi:MAG: phage terminase large subunit [Fibromonadaceae bacterium]|jgi:phage terminase large subunit-like protein|nr:phage terminase large subunit [Fibromonadaceae bacterium]